MEYLKEYNGNITNKMINGLKKLGSFYNDFAIGKGIKEDFYYYTQDRKNFKIIYSIIVDNNINKMSIGKIMTEPVNAKIEDNATDLIREFIKNIEKIEGLRGKFTKNDFI
ncbi:hypothetical protein [Fusobacterium varium]